MMTEFATSLHTAVREAQSILLTGPMDPDGDSIGACLALRRAILADGDAHVHVAGEANYRYDWMPDAAVLLDDADLDASYDLVVVMDGDRTRLTPTVSALFAAAPCTALVDHHRSTDPSGYSLAMLDPDSASTCEMVHGLLGQWGTALNKSIATQLYVGIIFDTGGFRHPNTQPQTHRLAATLLEYGVEPSLASAKVLSERTQAGLRLLGDVLTRASFFGDGAVVLGTVAEASAARFGIESGDMEGVIDALLNTQGVELACLATERAGAVKVSLRSRSIVDVAALARSMDPGGGGHARAAGVTLAGGFSTILEALPDALCQAVEQAR